MICLSYDFTYDIILGGKLIILVGVKKWLFHQLSKKR